MSNINTINLIKYGISQTQTHFYKSSNSHLYTQSHSYTPKRENSIQSLQQEGKCCVIVMNWLSCNYASERREQKQQFRRQFGRRLQLGSILMQ